VGGSIITSPDIMMSGKRSWKEENAESTGNWVWKKKGKTQMFMFRISKVKCEGT